MALSQNTDLETTFHRLADTWHKETVHISSVEQLAIHPAYQRIIGLGQPAVPLILNELRASPNHWFWALKAITGDDPVPPEHAASLKLMAQNWLNRGTTSV